VAPPLQILPANMTTLDLVQANRALRAPAATFWDRSYATNRLAEEVRRAEGDGNYEFSILLVAFEGLRHLTGRLGYASEDGTWRRVLALLTQDLRQGDLCSRLGEDEFLLILPGRGEAACKEVADHLFRRWSPAPGAREAAMEMSIGIASYPGNACTTEQLIGVANETRQSKTLPIPAPESSWGNSH
jgi:diguanylate cyclase (GGDEF)-like protein